MEKRIPKVNVYDKEPYGEIVARVNYNSNLDYWDGSNMTGGGLGIHLGITKLRDGRMVLIRGTEWQGEEDCAVVVSDETAIQAILKSEKPELLKKFKLQEKAKDIEAAGNLSLNKGG